MLLFLSIQFLQKLNVMDYSLLVGIHDPSIPRGADEDEVDEIEYLDDGQGISGDELEHPRSPSSATGEYFVCSRYTCTCTCF